MIQHFLRHIAISASLLAGAVSSATADPLLFTVTGDNTVSWYMDSNPVPSYSVPTFTSAFNHVIITLNGVSGLDAHLGFYTEANQGGFGITAAPDVFIETVGAQVFTGTPEAPVFAPGSWHFSSGFLTPQLDYTLTITAVPEPATMAMFLAGLGLVAVARSRSRAR